MCTHLYKHCNEFCDFNETFSSQIPIHPESGHCVLHSTDLDWKRNQNCTDWLIKLIAHQDQIGDIELYDLIIVGDKITESSVIHEDKQKVDFEGATHISMICHAMINNGIVFFDCHFYDEIYLKNLVFNDIVAINACSFHKGFLLENVSCREDANIEKGCTFDKEFAIIDSYFIGQLSINNNTFHGEFSIGDCFFDLPLHVMGNVYASTDLHVTFSSTFMSGFAFDHNTYSGLLSFEESVLHGKCSIEANNGTPWVNLFEVDLHGTFRFEGTPENLLFQTAAEIKIDDIEIHPGALMIFDYCNMLNISQDFLMQLKDLEREGKVSILDTCKLYRFHSVYIYNIEKESDDLFQDFHQLVARYFLIQYLQPLVVTMERLDDDNIKVFYASVSEIEDFEALQNKVLVSINKEPAPTLELEIQRQAALLRMGNLVEQGLLSQENQIALRSNLGKIEVKELKMVIKEFKAEKGSTLQISQASIKSMQVEHLVIENLERLKDPVRFQLSQSQLEKIKAEVLSLSDLAGISKSVNDILKNLNDRTERENSVKEFLLGHGVSVIGSMTGATLFTFLKYAFPF